MVSCVFGVEFEIKYDLFKLNCFLFFSFPFYPLLLCFFVLYANGIGSGTLSRVLVCEGTESHFYPHL